MVDTVDTKGKQAGMPIKISLLGMDERSAMRMETIFKVVFKERCIATSIEEANLVIVDLDGGADVWEKFQQKHSSLPAVALSASPSAAEGAIYISKPAKLDLLWKSILHLVSGLDSKDDVVIEKMSPEVLSSESETIEITQELPAAIVEDLTSETAAANVQSAAKLKSEQDDVQQVATKNTFNPDDYLLGTILSRLNSDAGRQCTIHMQCWEDRQLILIPDEGKVFTDLTAEQMETLCEPVVDENTSVEINSICGTGTNETKSLWYRAYARLLGKGDLPTIGTDGLKSMPLDYLLWTLAQHTARGRVPLGTDLSKPLYLQCWPNFTRLPHMDNGMRIASLWVENAFTLDEIASKLGITPAEVYSFYSAAAVIGLAGPEKRQSGTLTTSPAREVKHKVQDGLREAILRLAAVTR